MGVDTIRKVLARDLSLGDALRLQLAAVEAPVASLQGVDASAEASGAIVHDHVAGVARAWGKRVDAAFCVMFRERFGPHDARTARYRELLAIMDGQPSATGTAEDWRFIAEAVRRHLPQRVDASSQGGTTLASRGNE